MGRVASFWISDFTTLSKMILGSASSERGISAARFSKFLCSSLLNVESEDSLKLKEKLIYFLLVFVLKMRMYTNIAQISRHKKSASVRQEGLKLSRIVLLISLYEWRSGQRRTESRSRQPNTARSIGQDQELRVVWAKLK